MQSYDVIERWADYFNRGDAAALAALYAPEATIWGTLGQSITSQPAEITGYFEAAFRAGLTVKLQAHVLQPISDESAIIAGHYEFARFADGKATALPARYSFVLVKQAGAWRIAHQHSSLMPKPMGA
jgi:uncharacterized protein (TIGR02246 family)